MAGLYDMIYTVDGSLLLADIIAKGATLDITKMVIGSGYMPDGKSMGQMRTVVDPRIELPIKKKIRADDKAEIIIGSDFNNSEVTESFFYRELGVFAKGIYPDGTESDETLYMYGNAGDSAEYIPAHAGATAVEKRIDIITYVGSKTNVSVEIKGSLYVPQDVFDEEIQRINDQMSQSAEELNTLKQKFEELTILKLQVSGEKPDPGPWIWFDDQMDGLKPDTEFLLDLTAGDSGEVQAEVERKNYNVENATTSEQQITNGSIFVDVIN